MLSAINMFQQQPKVNFCATRRIEFTSGDYQKAKKYLSERIGVLRNQHRQLSLVNFDLTKLNGIQKDIEVFKGLSMKEIAFTYDHLSNIAAYRGCPNLCACCYANAIPHNLHNLKGHVSSMSKEDFDSLALGIKKLNSRLGFSAIRAPKKEYNDAALFHDSDCSVLEIKDKTGKTHDFIDLSRIFANSSGHPILFDTVGWNKNDSKTQQKIDKIVKYLLSAEGQKNVDSINISINPFHITNVQSIKNKGAGNIQEARKCQDKYVERMANVLYTFLPLLNDERFNFITRAAYGGEYKEYKKSALDKLIQKILKELEDQYLRGVLHEKPRQVKATVKALKEKIYPIFDISSAGRGSTLFNFKSQTYISTEKTKHEDIKALHENLKSQDCFYTKTIDANGRVYVTNFISVFPTQVRLNFANKNKKTLPLGDESGTFLITKKMIDRDF